MRPRTRGSNSIAVDAPGALGHVDHEVARTLDLRREPDRGDDGPQVAGHRLLEREHVVAALLDLDRQLVEHVVVLDERLRAAQVDRQQDLGAAGDELGGQGGEPHDVVADLLELLVEGLCRLLRALGASSPHLGGQVGRVAGQQVAGSAGRGSTAWSLMRWSDWPATSDRSAIAHGVRPAEASRGVSVSFSMCRSIEPRARRPAAPASSRSSVPQARDGVAESLDGVVGHHVEDVEAACRCAVST